VARTKGKREEIESRQRRQCRFIIPDEVKYKQNKSQIHLIDADGKECIGDLVRQERIASQPTAHP
jgi:hypothetical protein